MPKLSEVVFTVLDTETTGPEPGKDKPIELALLQVKNKVIGEPLSWFIDPERPIPPESSAVHHLVDEDIAGAPVFDVLWPQVAPIIGDSVIVAHNAPFDISMLPPLANHKVICTFRLAKHLWEKGQKNERGFPLANHQQQVLRYWLGFKVDTLGLAAHRAAADILVTAQLLNKEIELYLEYGGEDDLDALIEYIQTPIEVKALPFGKYKDIPLSKVPVEYLENFMDAALKNTEKPMDPDMKASIKRILDLKKAKDVMGSR